MDLKRIKTRICTYLVLGIRPYSSRKLNDCVAVDAENDLEMCVGKG